MSDFGRLDDPTPHARFLGVGRHQLLVTGAGSGAAGVDRIALTPWSADRTEDAEGFFVYLRDRDDGRLWSAGHEPVRAAASVYQARYEPGVVRLERIDGAIATRLDVCVAPDDDVEVRRLTLENRGDRRRRLEVTTYAEVALIEAAAYAAHPAFAKLFVETEYDPAREVLLARRRPRSASEHYPWLLHACAGPGVPEWETDRARFIGRGRTLASPDALTRAAPLSGTVGSVLDPIVSMRRVVALPPGATAVLAIVLGTAPTRAAALDLATRYAPTSATAAEVAGDVFRGAAERERMLLRSLALTDDDGERLQELAGAMLYGDPRLRASGDVLRRARGSTTLLSQYGVRSGALLVLATARRSADRTLVSALLRACRYWEAKGIDVDLVVLCDGASLTDDMRTLAAAAAPAHVIVRQSSELDPSARDLVAACAHLVVTDAIPDLRADAATTPTAARDAVARATASAGASAAMAARTSGADTVPAGRDLVATSVATSVAGAFSADGSEYVLTLDGGATAVPRPPLPWVNVVANESFGFLVSESGAACTWSRNSRENRITPWHNDPVSDPHSEALYVRDDETGAFWSPLPGPVTPEPPSATTDGAADAAHESTFEVRHGLGYTVWRRRSSGLEHEVTAFVPQRPAEPVKISRVRLTNIGDTPRRLSLFAYYRLVLGGVSSASGRFVVSELDDASQALFARNRLNDEFADAVVCIAAVAPPGSATRFTADRSAFLGRHGSPAAPAAIATGGALDGRTGAALDPCAAVQIRFEIAPHATVACALLLGEAADETTARALIARHRVPGAIDRAECDARAFWDDLRGGVQVTTPVPAIDHMVNAWLPYQILSCRIWGRSAFYQSGGAFGFRDQLQDAAAFAVTRPELTRAQILLHAAHQFVEGDVLHWWHPPLDRGIRTHFSDDLLWLPWITARYVATTGDAGVLDERVGFVTARPLAAGEDEAYLLPTEADDVAGVYAHCCRALDRSLATGAHGLPLMGTGDWNDGMNRVGREGRGESVWMGFFLFRVLDDFVPLCEHRGDGARVDRYRAHQARLRAALETAGWDGAWYRRAYYDDGSVLGSAANEECKIDALAQAWAVLSHAVPRARAAQAMDAALRLLVDEAHGLVRLLTPPFDRDPRDPGYIKGYVPGIRENGGQYTHAALWVVEALAELGRRDRAAALLEMLCPATHAATPAGVATYCVEPYVIAADVYGVAPHIGRGGWTWYTGSAAWMHRIAVESILGVRLVGGDTLVVAPRIPDTWPGFTVRLRVPHAGEYEIVVTNPSGRAEEVRAVSVDGAPAVVVDGEARIAVERDRERHRIEVVLGTTSGSR